MKRLPLILLFSLLWSLTAAAQDLSQYEKVLFPAFSEQPVRGANATFQTFLRAWAKQPVAFYPAQNGSFGVQPAGIGFIDVHEVRAGSPGRLLYFERTRVDDIRFFYELAIAGPDGRSHGTTLPVVREREFLTGPSVLLGLATTPLYESAVRVPEVIGYAARNHLRIYDVDNTGTLSVKVRVTVDPLSAYGSWASYDVNVDARVEDDPSHPYYAVIALPDLCITAPTGIRCRAYPLTVTIEPNDPNARYYAIASATDNATAETTVYYAQ